MGVAPRLTVSPQPPHSCALRQESVRFCVIASPTFGFLRVLLLRPPLLALRHVLRGHHNHHSCALHQESSRFFVIDVITTTTILAHCTRNHSVSSSSRLPPLAFCEYCHYVHHWGTTRPTTRVTARVAPVSSDMHLTAKTLGY